MHCLKRENVHVFLNNEGTIEILPTFFSEASLRSLQFFSFQKTKEISSKAHPPLTYKLNSKDESTRTVKEALARLNRFMDWIENVADYTWEINGETYSLGLHNHHYAHSSILNDYINKYLIDTQLVSEQEAKAHIGVLKHYYAYLQQSELIEDGIKDLYIDSKLKEKARDNTNKKTGVKYFTRATRKALYSIALTEFSLRDYIILRCGGDVGVRSCELRGFVLYDFYIGKTKYNGLRSLFHKISLTNDAETPELKFLLNGKYSKDKPNEGGESRWLMIPYDLLERMKDYYDNDRPKDSDSKHLFINESRSHGITDINEDKGGEVFRKIKKVLNKFASQGLLYQDAQEITDQSYHVLRHSFGTDLFWSLSKGNPERIIPTSKEFMYVAERMGHRICTYKNAGKTTIKYIRSAQLKESLEGKLSN